MQTGNSEVSQAGRQIPHTEKNLTVRDHCQQDLSSSIVRIVIVVVVVIPTRKQRVTPAAAVDKDNAVVTLTTH